MFNCIETFLRYSSTSITRSKNPVNQSFFLPYKKKDTWSYFAIYLNGIQEISTAILAKTFHNENKVSFYINLKILKYHKRRIFGIVTNSTSEILSIIKIYDLPNEKKKKKGKIVTIYSTPFRSKNLVGLKSDPRFLPGRETAYGEESISGDTSTSAFQRRS